MRVFKTLWFQRYIRKHGISDDVLLGVVRELEHGYYNADLGGNVYKQRVAREHEGKSGGYRFLVCFKMGERAFFTYGFAKSEKENITPTEKDDLKKLSRILLALSEEVLNAKVAAGAFMELAMPN